MVMECDPKCVPSAHGDVLWILCGTEINECQFKYFAQAILAFVVMIFSVVGLLMFHDDQCSGVVWGALLGTAVGILIPTTKIYKVGVWVCCGRSVPSKEIIYVLQLVLIYSLVIRKV
jgi:hypothetical protein